MSITDFITTVLYRQMTFKERKLISHEVVANDTWNVSTVSGSDFERYINTYAAIVVARQHIGDADCALLSRGYDLTQYEIPQTFVDMINASIVYLTDAANVLNKPMFKAKVDDVDDFFSPIEFNAFQQQFRSVSGEDDGIFKDVKKFEPSTVVVNDLHVVFVGGKLHLLHPQGSYDAFTILFNYSLPDEFENMLPLTGDSSIKEAILWLTK